MQPSFLKYFHDPTPSAIGGIVAAFSAGATFGAFGCAYVADPIGRVWSLRIGAIIAVVGTALQAGSVHVCILALLCTLELTGLTDWYAPVLLALPYIRNRSPN